MTGAVNISLDYHIWSVEEYHKMVELNLLTKEDKVELLNGNIIRMSPIGKFHSAVLDKVLHWIRKEKDQPNIIRVQSPIVVDSHSVPEPDLCILKWDDRFYADRDAQASDVLLLIEVADSSLEKDRKEKGPIYANSDIPEYWIINLNDQQVEIYLDPKDGVYSRVLLLKKDQTFESPLLGRVRVNDLLI